MRGEWRFVVVPDEHRSRQHVVERAVEAFSVRHGK
jgi:hypothetical protein